MRDNSTSANVKGIANKNAIDDMMNRASQTYIPPKGTDELEAQANTLPTARPGSGLRRIR